MSDNIVQLASRKPKEPPMDDMSGFCFQCGHCQCKTWFICADFTVECTGCGRYTTFAEILDKPKPAG